MGAPVHRATALAVNALLGLLAGCTDEQDFLVDPVVAAGEPVSGTRLQARYLKADDGTRVFHGWFDNVRNEFCRVARGEGGRYYCFPENNPAAFRDNRCREPVGELRACPRRYTGVSRGDRLCSNETLALWEEEEGVFPLPSPFRLVNDFCLAPAQPEGPGRYVNLRARIADSGLAAGNVDVLQANLRLQPRMVRFEDGAVATLGLYDLSRSRPCMRVETSQGIRCLPENVLYVSLSGPYFSDRACGQPVAHAIAPPCFMPSLALQVDSSGGCPMVTGAFRVEPRDRLDPRQVFWGPTCQNGMIIPGHFYRLSEAMDVTAFPELKVKESGTGRLRVRTFTAGDGVALLALGQHVYDSALDTECQLAVASDGVHRCLPLTGPVLNAEDSVQSAFADAGCTLPLARYEAIRACTGARPPAPMVARVSQQHCQAPETASAAERGDPQAGRWAIHRLGERHQGEVFVGRPDACQPLPVAAGQEYYQLGEAVNPAEFVAFRAD
jgi:hypothetical protein